MFQLCRACMIWCRAAGSAQAGATHIVNRSSEGDPDAWGIRYQSSAFSVGLLGADERELADAFERSGLEYDRLTEVGVRRFASHPDGVLFVGASTEGLAATTMGHLPPEARSRVVVVTGFHTLSDTVRALWMGAGDWLVSPLSLHQVAASVERVLRAEGRPSRCRMTGLPVLSRSWTADPPVPRHMLRIEVQDGHDGMEVAWLLRRFTRGYDRVGVNDLGQLVLEVACPPADVTAVIARLRPLLSEEVRSFTVVEDRFAHVPAERREALAA